MSRSQFYFKSRNEYFQRIILPTWFQGQVFFLIKMFEYPQKRTTFQEQETDFWYLILNAE